MPSTRQAFRYLVLASALWGLSFPTNKVLGLIQGLRTPGLESWAASCSILVGRFALAALILGLMLAARPGPLGLTRNELIQGIGLGLFGGLGMLLQVDALHFTEASTSAFLTQGTVFLVPLAKALIDHHAPSLRESACCLLAVLGVAILAGLRLDRFTVARGEAETLLAAVFFTGHILWLERPRFSENDADRISLVMFASVPLVCCLPFLAAPAQIPLAANLLRESCNWFFLAVLVVPCTLASFCWMNRWQRQVSATMAGLIYCTEPVFASLFALFLPAWFSSLGGVTYANELLTSTLVIGGGLILLANVLIQWPAKK